MKQKIGEQPFARRKTLVDTLKIEPEIVDSVAKVFPVLWPNYYLGLTGSDETHPIAKMGRPTAAELELDAGDLADPVADMAQRPIPFVVRKHRDRVILLTTKKCHFYCRFCFRRSEPFHATPTPSQSDWEAIFAWLEANPEVEEPILSGGDPLTLSDEKLFWIKARLAEIKSVKRWRIHSRAPVHFPQRITPELLSGLAKGMAPRLVTHFNHRAEITEQSAAIADQCHRLGIELLNQAVLLNGVNNRLEDQISLWSTLDNLGIKAHYLHHPDRAQGNANFRVSIGEGRRLYREFVRQLGSEPPKYVLDLPDGRGKISVMKMAQTEPEQWTYHHPDGKVSIYNDWSKS